MDPTRCTERLVVADERRPAIATRMLLAVPLPGPDHDARGLAKRPVRVVSLAAASVDRERRILERFQRRSDLWRS